MPDSKGSQFSNADRERIIKMDVKVDRLISDVAEINKNFSGRIAALEATRIERTEFEKFANLIRADIATATAESVKEAGLKQDRLEDKVVLLNKIVYGCVGTILLTVLIAIIKGVLSSSN